MISVKKISGSFMMMTMLSVVALPAAGKGVGMDFTGTARTDTMHEGLGHFVYTGYRPLADKPVTVYYYMPSHLPDDAPIMILMTGTLRNAKTYRENMRKYADRYKFLLIVPEFSKKYYPYSRDYHQGGVFEKGGKMKDKRDWTFSIIEPLFEYVKRITGKDNEGYILYGFSAGAQFIHRYTLFFPDNSAVHTISSSAGSYTMPDYDINYKYGLGKTHIPKKNLKKAFAKDFTVVVGDADTVLSHKYLPKSKKAEREGKTRVERAAHFYEAMREFAVKNNYPFHWKFTLVPHVGHSNKQMAGPVTEVLFDKSK